MGEFSGKIRRGLRQLKAAEDDSMKIADYMAIGRAGEKSSGELRTGFAHAVRAWAHVAERETETSLKSLPAVGIRGNKSGEQLPE